MPIEHAYLNHSPPYCTENVNLRMPFLYREDDINHCDAAARLVTSSWPHMFRHIADTPEDWTKASIHNCTSIPWHWELLSCSKRVFLLGYKGMSTSETWEWIYFIYCLFGNLCKLVSFKKGLLWKRTWPVMMSVF